MEDKPTAAFILALIGGVLIFLGTLSSFILNIVLINIFSRLGLPGTSPINIAPFVALGLWGAVCGTLTVAGALWINTGEKPKVKRGSILVLVFSILSWIGAEGGLVIGFILCLIGAILGLTWKPQIKEEPPALPIPP